MGYGNDKTKDDASTEEVTPTAPSADGTEVTQDAAPAENAAAPAAVDPGSHVYHEVAEGVQGRVTTQAEKEARNAQAQAADTLAAAQAAANG